MGNRLQIVFGLRFLGKWTKQIDVVKNLIAVEFIVQLLSESDLFSRGFKKSPPPSNVLGPGRGEDLLNPRENRSDS